eukprot:gb/GECG01007221.1/.p1 GENE.gb/GECG01007221.1/~~gb/GECG01007221.1/.p1  ORF type:complete len:1912 (+),score=224.19 gb/GECG01007221.1/:1-5736(+)
MSYWRQTGILLRKNYILKKRSPCGTLCEILMPVLLVLILVGVYNAVNEDHTATQQYLVQREDGEVQEGKHNKPVLPFGLTAFRLNKMNAKIVLAPGTDQVNKEDCQWLQKRLNDMNPGLAHVAPSFSEVSKVMDSQEQLENDIKSDNYASNPGDEIYFAAIVLNKVDRRGGGHWDYSIRMNSSAVPTTFENVDILQRGVDTGHQQKYLEADSPFDSAPKDSLLGAPLPGFLTLQRMVDRCIINRTIDGHVGDAFFNDLWQLSRLGIHPTPDIEELRELFRGELYAPQTVRMAPFPVKGFTSNAFYTVVENALPIFLLITFLAPTSSLIRGIVLEKENRIREGMQMMGLATSALYSSWFLTYFFVFLTVSLIISIITVASFFSNTDFFALFLLFLLFGVSTTAFCFLVAVFFNRSKTGATVGVLLYFGAFFPFYAVQGPSHSLSSKTAASLLSPTAFAQAVVVLANFEDRGQGVSFGENATLQFRNYSFSTGIFMMILDTLIYLMLAWYFDSVWPREYGVRQSPWFCLTPGYWKRVCGCKMRKSYKHPQKDDMLTTNEIAQGNPLVEPVSNEMLSRERDNKGVRIKNLRKEFDSGSNLKVAVDNLSMNIHEGEVFVLLGHNGAGKTTTISMLTGLLSPTSGKMHVYDEDVTEDLNAIRKYLGVCPQHDVLWDNLTVEEHLKLFAGLKEVPRAEVDAAVGDIIKEVGLTEKVRVKSKQLSGGQKRKLSVAIALIGNSKVVMLDEPTSGMDPYSRRSTWDIIQNARRDRIVLMTTHFMDEADILGDRISIMANGKLKCCGSGMFLKHKYGVGYLLTAVKKSGKDGQKKMINMIRQNIPDAEIQSEVGTELSVRLPMHASSKFPTILSKLDDNLGTYGIETYGLSATTLEEVFLRVAHDEDEAETTQQSARDKSTGDYSGIAAPLSDDKTPLVEATEMRGGYDAEGLSIEQVREHARKLVEDSFGRHFRALVLKRFHYYKRDAKAACFQLVVPILAVLFGLLLIRAGQISGFPSYELSSAKFNTQSDGSTLPNRVPYMSFLWNSSDDSVGHVDRLEYFNHAISMIPNVNVSKLHYSLEDSQTQEDIFHFYSGTFGSATAANFTQYEPLVNLSTHILDISNDYKASIYGSYAPFVPPGIDPGSNENISAYIVQQNTTAFHACPIFMNIMNWAFYRDEGIDAYITTRNHPLPFTGRQETLISGIGSFSAALIIVLAFAFIPASYAIFVVKEREIAAKHQQLISGVSIPAYWISTFLWDFASYLLPMAGTIILIAIFDVKELISTDRDRLLALFLLLFLYGTSVSGFTYCLTYLFKNYSSAQNFVLFINMLAMIMVLASFIMSQVSSTCEANEGLKYIFLFFPGYALGNGLVDLAFLSVLRQMTKCGHDQGSGSPAHASAPLTALDADAALPNILYMALLSVIYFAITVGIDFLLSRPDILQRLQRKPKPSNERSLLPNEIDPDVLEEEKRCEKQGNSYSATDDAILLQHLRKVYGDSKVAVRDISFGVPVGEVFGFLGINGAGKTSTLKMITGDILPTSGQARLAGYDIISEQNHLRTLLGYCPQFEALLELLTVREHLELFARIKGIPNEEIESVVKAKIRQLSLVEFENKRAGSLSGGNKRKLSVAIALIGNPPILFLDEPSTGMDPATRRVMWDVIADIATTRREASIVLTTHSMEECEALATRVGIMVGGRLRCLGSIQHIKNTHAQGYQMRIKLDNPSQEDIAQTEQAVKSSVSAVDRVSEAQLSTVCGALGDPSMLDEVNADGTGWMVYSSIEGSTDRSVSIRELSDWWVEEQQIKSVLNFVYANFENSELIERQGTLLSFKIPPQNMRLSRMFDLLESARSTQNIREYALSQTSLEQVFNYFAAQQEEERGPAPGLTRQVSKDSKSASSFELERKGDEQTGSLRSSLLKR